jgi:hypothetical protein
VAERPFVVVRMKARAPRLQRVAGQMNATERRYSEVLDARVHVGQVAEWWYEALTLKLAHDTRYTPDFMVVLADGSIECHEVKGGFYREDAQVKVKVAARMFPFTFRMARRVEGAWQIEEVAP